MRAAVLGLALSACHTSANDDSLVVAVDSRPRVFDPRLATSDIDGRVVRLLYAGLTTVDTPDALPQPLLAQTIERVSDTELIATIRPNLRFHDGSPLGVRDVICTVESLRHNAIQSPFSADWQATRATMLDESRVRFTTEAADPTLELRLDMGILPCAATATNEAVGIAGFVGSGPWILETQQRDGTVELAANPHWFRGKPAFEHVRIRPIADGNTRVMGLLAGTIDIVANGVPPALLPVVADDASLRVSQGPALRYTYLVFQLDRTLFADVRVRRAVSLAIDREALVAHRFGGSATLATGVLPPTHWAYVAAPQVVSNVAEASALVAAAHPEVDAEMCRVHGTLSSSSNRLYRGVAGVIIEQLRLVGICLEQRSYEWATFFADVKAGDFDVALLQWTSIVDPGHYAWAFHTKNIPSANERSSGGNRGRWRDPMIDAWLDAAAIETNSATRSSLYGQVQQRANELLPYVSLWHEDNIVVFGSELLGVEAIPTGRLAWLSEVRLADEPE